MARKKVGKRRTAQREAILEVILEAGRPLTVHEIHSRAAEDAQSLGIATVYRTIKLLLEGERIRSVTLPDGEARYEPTGLHHHHHFQCRSCESVFDFDLCPISIPEGTVFPSGFVLEDHSVTLYGLCPDCNARGDAGRESADAAETAAD